MPLDRHVQELLDKQAITEQLVTYCRAADRVDLDLLRSVFHPDAAADYGAMYSGTGYGFADFIGEVHPPMEAHSHHIGNILVRVDGDRAASESYVLVRARTRDGDTLTDLVCHGRYLDRWERRDGTWRISDRRYLHTLDETRTVKLPLFDTAGSRDRDDPSYALMGSRA
ncbi:nuclear transport factor 2 family protein [Actinomadura nitritigenes]|uniref:nuclear transport factor 2 family protein n=1 Tax=Actinomadura nitritigenes TaxID=134602 RepID=UPI003D92D4F9